MKNRPSGSNHGQTSRIYASFRAATDWKVGPTAFFNGLIGIVMGGKGMSSNSRGMAIAGLVLSIIGLVVSLSNAILGAYLAVTGQHPLINQ